MRYCLAKYKDRQDRLVYRVYVTDALRIIAENTAKNVGGSYLQARYADFVVPQKEETRTSDEVIAHMKSVMGSLEVVE